jgi:hypothetical protein
VGRIRTRCAGGCPPGAAPTDQGSGCAREEIELLDREIARRAREHDAMPRLMTLPGVGPIAATAPAAWAEPAEAFRKKRDFADDLACALEGVRGCGNRL